jgi:amidase
MQELQTADSENNIYGRALNPHNTAWTAGGSSGGEGALVAFRGSILGVGTDIAGSVRIPSLCCGTYGFKPTPGRIPYGGMAPGPNPILPGLMPVAGPLATSLPDLELFMRLVAGQEPRRYDDGVLPIPWRGMAGRSRRALIIGVLAEDPEYPLHPPVRRALASAVHALKRASHTLVELPNNPSLEPSLGMRIAFHYFGLGGPLFRGDLIQEAGEPLVKSVENGTHYSPEPPIVQPDLEWREMLTELAKARGAYSEAWRRTWTEYGLDVVLAPGAQNTAVKHDTYGLPPYTVMWNLLDVSPLRPAVRTETRISLTDGH